MIRIERSPNCLVLESFFFHAEDGIRYRNVTGVQTCALPISENMGAGESELDVLAVFSHPDDAELTAAGTLLKMKSFGYRTGVLDVTRGEMGTRGTPDVRAEEAREAARIMGLDVRLNLEQPDGHVWLTEAARTALVRVIRAYRPKVLLTAHWDDPHPDHANTARIVREAARLASMRRYDEEAGQGAVAVP